MNVIIPAAFGVAAISVLTKFLGEPILVAIKPPPPPSDALHCEGYYAPMEDCLPLGTTRPPWFKRRRSNARCPQWQIDNKQWSGRELFISKLKDMESAAKEYEELLSKITAVDVARFGGEEGLKPSVWIQRYRGLAWSRMQESIIAGNSEFHSDASKEEGGGEGGHVCWTDALLDMYVEKFGLKPSEEFVNFVATFDLGSIEKQINMLKQPAPSEKAQGSS